MEHFLLDVSNLEGTNAYCSAESAEAIRKDAEALPLCAVHDIGNGNYHYLSLFFLERISEPFDLVLFDHHPDDQCGAFDQDMLSCGNWVKVARETLPNLRRVHWFGGPQDPGFPQGDLPVYVSVDLDVLDQRYIRTVWDQGDMTMEELEGILSKILSEQTTIGVDICGSSDPQEPAVLRLYEIVSMSKPFSQGIM